MAQMSAQCMEVLDKALALSVKERGLLIDRLVESLDDGPAEEGVEEAWADEIKRRVDDVRSGKAEMVPMERIKERLNARRRDVRG
jgi:putative addiction module component (TIGR02574 family)